MFLCCDFQKAEAGASARSDDSRRSSGGADVCAAAHGKGGKPQACVVGVDIGGGKRERVFIPLR